MGELPNPSVTHNRGWLRSCLSVDPSQQLLGAFYVLARAQTLEDGQRRPHPLVRGLTLTPLRVQLAVHLEEPGFAIGIA
jgi:hypothetical protein